MNPYANFHQSEEDYLENILYLAQTQQIVHRIDIARRLNVSQAAVNKAVKILMAKEYVYEEGKHLYLTEKGKAYAQLVYEKHHIIRGFLMKLGVSENVAEEDACRLEHLVSEETFSKMKDFLHK